MNNVLSAELYKLKNNIAFYVCLVMVVAVSVISAITTKSNTAESMAGMISASIPVFIAISTAAIACDDYEKSTMKNLICSGNSRGHIYMGKLLAAFCAGFIYFLVDGLASIISGYVLNGLGSGLTPITAIESLAVQLLLTCVFVLTFFGFSSLFRSSKAGTIFGIVYVFFIASLPQLLGEFVFNTDLTAFSLETMEKNISNLHFSVNMIINFAIYGGVGLLLNILAFFRFKKYSV